MKSLLGKPQSLEFEVFYGDWRDSMEDLQGCFLKKSVLILTEKVLWYLFHDGSNDVLIGGIEEELRSRTKIVRFR